MARATVDLAALKALEQDLAEAYFRGPAHVVLREMQRESPVRTGLMRASHAVDRPRRVGVDWLIRYRVKADRSGFPYPIAVHNGRGWVYPVRKKALRWVTRAGAVVFAKSARPSRPNPWLWRTFVRLGFRNVTRGSARR
jgi:hypothetical protein